MYPAQKWDLFLSSKHVYSKLVWIQPQVIIIFTKSQISESTDITQIAQFSNIAMFIMSGLIMAIIYQEKSSSVTESIIMNVVCLKVKGPFLTPTPEGMNLPTLQGVIIFIFISV